LGGGDEGDELGDEASGVFFVVDGADDGSVSSVEDIGEEVLSPHDSDAVAWGWLCGVGWEEGNSIWVGGWGEECGGVAFVDFDWDVGGHLDLLFRFLESIEQK